MGRAWGPQKGKQGTDLPGWWILCMYMYECLSSWGGGEQWGEKLKEWARITPQPPSDSTAQSLLDAGHDFLYFFTHTDWVPTMHQKLGLHSPSHTDPEGGRLVPERVLDYAPVLGSGFASLTDRRTLSTSFPPLWSLISCFSFWHYWVCLRSLPSCAILGRIPGC